MDFRNTPYFHVGRASDLKGRDRVIYRLFEMVPGSLAWLSIIGIIILSKYAPVWAAYFIIAFDLYWLLKTMYLSIHLRQNFKRMKINMNRDWAELLSRMKSGHIYHMVILPFYEESFDVVEKSVISVIEAKKADMKTIFVLAREEKVGESARKIALKIEEKYKSSFTYFLNTAHPAGVVGEMPGKGSNITYAAKEARKLLDSEKIQYEDVIVSAFDSDTVVYPDYFLCLAWYFLSQPKPTEVSYQPVPLYNNNIWNSPAFSRVVASSGTFWQMIQQERPEKLATFSSHAVSFKTLVELDYWQTNMVSEDSRIFWNAFMAYDGKYKVVPISYPVSMDANLAGSFWGTVRNVYKQQRRWAWGSENVAYILMGFLKNKNISLWKKIRVAATQIEGYWSLSTNPIFIFLLGWLPLILGSNEFRSTVLSYNLPVITRNLMILCMFGLVLSAVISLKFLPPPPPNTSKFKKIGMVLQWILVPFTIMIFGAVPGLDAQTRLLFGRYMGFWVTPKYRIMEEKKHA
ncbi:MAG TPA: glycosyltransferase family 2 protein [Candidatus Paceibacterota bacterium]|nr:glycosyltransferase family 2 protein [Candidatus Paceibacterota bacterium]